MTVTAAPRPYRQLSAAMRALARDFEGFGDADASFGRVLAESPPEAWSPKMAQAAHRIAARHAVALRRYGVDVREISTPDEADRRARKKGPPHGGVFEAGIADGFIVLSSKGGWPGHGAITAVKAMPGRSYRKKPRPHWRVPLSAAPHVLQAIADGIVKAPADVLAELRQVVEHQRTAAEDSHRTDAELSVEGLGGTPRPFQRAGVDYIIKHRRCFLADEMGLGKTVQALIALQALMAYPAVAVVPAGLKLQWAEEARKWLPLLRRIEVLSGRKPLPLPPDTGLAIVNYDVLSAWRSTLAKLQPRALIFDESQLLKTSATKRAKAARSLAQVDSLDVVVMLSGTPIENGTHEWVSQLRILGRLQDLGGFYGFKERYLREGYWGGFVGGRNLGELNARMRQLGIYIRRLKADVLDELPAKQRVRVPIELRPQERARYEKTLAKVAKRLRAARIHRAKARQSGVEPEGWAAAAPMVAVGELRRAAAECKLPGALDWIRLRLAAGDRLVIFGHHVDIVERLAAELGCPLIKGGVAATKRKAIVDRFQAGELPAVVLNLKAGGVGLTLTAASNVAFVESAWTPSANDQAEDRCHRIGQQDSVTAWYLDAVNTIDPWLSDLIARKRQTVDAATEGDEKAEASIRAELAQMIAGLDA